VFRDEFAVTLGSLKEAQAAVNEFKEREQKRAGEVGFFEEFGGGGGGGGMRRAAAGGGGSALAPTRREFVAAPSMRRPPPTPSGGELELVPPRPVSAVGLDFAKASPLRSPSKGASV
jgi:hypothetical protein